MWQTSVKREKNSIENGDFLIHGGDLYGAAAASGRAETELLDFSANINPLGIQPEVKQAICGSMDRVLQYPDPLCRRLRHAIAQKEQAEETQVLCGNGGADLIYRFAYGLHPKKALIPAPAFAEYEEALVQAGTQLVFYELNGEKKADEGLLAALTPDVDAVFFCNPNNPTGLLTDRELLLALLEKARQQETLVFLDECFLDFVEQEPDYTLKGYQKDYPNLVILKSFTKMYAIPGLRLGYVLSGNRELLERMRLAGQPWSVGSLAQEAGLAALADPDFPARTRFFVARERAFLKEGLEALGCRVFDGAANYLCFQAPRGDTGLYERMLARGVILRRCANYRGLDASYYRAAVREHAENERLLTVLAEQCVRTAAAGQEEIQI